MKTESSTRKNLDRQGIEANLQWGNVEKLPFDFTEEDIGGFGSVHLYQARKLANCDRVNAT